MIQSLQSIHCTLFANEWVNQQETTHGNKYYIQQRPFLASQPSRQPTESCVAALSLENIHPPETIDND